MTVETDGSYRSSFRPSQEGLSVLKNGRIIMPGEIPTHMIERVLIDLSIAEKGFSSDPRAISRFTNELGALMDESAIVFSTPIMTNANRREQRPLSACVVPPVNLKGDLTQVRKMVETYHEEAMGTGFDLNDVDDPVGVLLFLNEVAINGANSGKEDRPVGNMATCRIDHAHIIEFIEAKAKRSEISWKFNISVDIPESFWTTIDQDGTITLTDGKTISARELLYIIAKSEYDSGEPGIICLDRLNKDNPVPGVGLYTSVAPCAEVGLIPGETCQFGYINIAKYADPKTKVVNYTELSIAARLMTRALDDVLELSIERYSIKESSMIMSKKRKIGLGICGVADMLSLLGIPYESEIARNLCRDIMAFINFQSKVASIDLAKDRGSFGAMMLKAGCRHTEDPSFIEKKYGTLETNSVSVQEWQQLGRLIRNTQQLRNSSTTALPPTGRSGLVIDASTGIEPYFSLAKNGTIVPTFIQALNDLGIDVNPLYLEIARNGTCQESEIPVNLKNVFKTATEISPHDHVRMVGALQPCIDGSISKTVNLPSTVTIEEIMDVLQSAHNNGLKAITVYRNGTKLNQPLRIIN